MTERLAVALEGTGKKVFASALDWPGWSRSGKTDDAAIETLLAYAPRYAPVVARRRRLRVGELVRHRRRRAPRRRLGDRVRRPEPAHRRQMRGPSTPPRPSGWPRIVEAAWATFDRVAAGAPAELRKGPRGGGRDRDKMVGHVNESDWYYAREIGIRARQPKPGDRAAVEALRAEVLAVLRQPSDGAPLADRKWPARYAARRIAWHALDHAWEIEDRST